MQWCSATDLAMTVPDGAALARGAQRSRRGGGVERSDANAVTDAGHCSSVLPRHVLGVGLNAQR